MFRRNLPALRVGQQSFIPLSMEAAVFTDLTLMTPYSRVLGKADSPSACQEIPLIVWHPQFRYRLSLLPILNHISSVHALPIDFFTNHFNIILPYTGSVVVKALRY